MKFGTGSNTKLTQKYEKVSTAYQVDFILMLHFSLARIPMHSDSAFPYCTFPLHSSLEFLQNV